MKKFKPTKKINRSIGGDITIFTMLALMAAFMALPLLYAVMQAFKPIEEVFLFPPRFFVQSPTAKNFSTLFQLTENMWVPFSRYLFNSFFVSAVATAGHVLFASAAAYPFAKHDFPGKKWMFKLVITALLFSGGTLTIPRYVIMANMGIINTYYSLILPMLASSLGLFLMKQFMEQIPNAVLESAKIDGANELRIYWSIVMPQVKPAWLTLIIFSFQAVWNESGDSMIYSEELKLLPTALKQIAAGGIERTGAANAAALLMMIPPIAIFILTQSNVIQTMSHSGIKE